MATGFVEIAVDVFSFLEKEFGFRKIRQAEENWGGEVVYINESAGTGIRLVYEFSSAFVFVFVYRLVKGKFVNNPLPIREDTEITCIDFNDTLDNGLKMRPAYEYGEDSIYYHPVEGLQNFVRDFASRLYANGKDFLGGDFSRFPQVERIIKSRAAQFK